MVSWKPLNVSRNSFREKSLIFRELLQRCPDLIKTVHPQTKRTAIHIAAQYGSVNSLQLMVRHGVFVERPDVKGKWK